MRRVSAALWIVLATAWLALAAPVAADPTLNTDGRSISTETDPPFSMPPDSAVPAAFAPFDRLVTQGGSQSCPMTPTNASSSAQQTSTVDPLSYVGTGGTAYSLMPGNCSSAFVDQWSIYEVTFTSDTDYVFDLDADLVNASLLLERVGGPVYVSVSDFTGPVTFQQQLPAHHYTIRVDVSLSAIASSGGPDDSDSGSYDFTLDLLPEPSGPAPAFCAALCLLGLARMRSRRD